MKSSEAAKLILELLSPRSAMERTSRKWNGYVFTDRGACVLQCCHPHGSPEIAKNCAAKLAKLFAHLEATRGVRP